MIRTLGSLLAASVALAGCSALQGPAATDTTPTGPVNADGSPADAAGVTDAGPSVQLIEVATLPPSVNAGETFTVRALAKNVGTDTVPIVVEFVVGETVVTTAKATLAPAESTLLAGSARLSRAGTFPLVARLQDGSSSATTSLVVHGPQLADGKIEVVPLAQCDRVLYRVSFKNVGDGPAMGLSLQAQVLDPQGDVADTVNLAVPDVPAGESTLVEVNHVVPARCPTPRTYTAAVTVTDQTGPALEIVSEPFSA